MHFYQCFLKKCFVFSKPSNDIITLPHFILLKNFSNIVSFLPGFSFYFLKTAATLWTAFTFFNYFFAPFIVLSPPLCPRNPNSMKLSRSRFRPWEINPVAVIWIFIHCSVLCCLNITGVVCQPSQYFPSFNLQLPYSLTYHKNFPVQN